MMLGGNGLVTWAEQRAHSGYAALLVACAPIWVSLLEAGIDRRRPSGLLVMALVVGLSGVGVLSAPVLLEGNSADAASVAALLAAGALWGMGTLLQHRRAVSLDPMTSSGYQQVLGAAFLIAVSLLAREPLPAPSGEATVAWGYLVIFGSLVAFTCFVRSLQLLPASVAMTYAYVNPVGAVLLGWLVLGEPIAPWTIGGAALVLLGVAGVFRSKGL
jgi:drug/metabolite transporter (DMT)-like permease